VKTISRHPAVIWDHVDGSLLLCQTDSATFLRLNDTGAAVWNNCSNVTVRELVRRLAELHPGIQFDEVTEVVVRFVEDLERQGFLRAGDQAKGPNGCHDH
jgi:hypothetical protein